MVPVSAVSAKPGSLTKAVIENALVCRYETADETHMMVFGGREKSWAASSFESDAEFVYWCEARSSGRGNLILCNGSYLDAGGKRLISASSPVLRCELAASDQGVDVFSSDENAVVGKDAIRTIWPDSHSGVPVSRGTFS
jgi:hypothetical protein